MNKIRVEKLQYGFFTPLSVDISPYKGKTQDERWMAQMLSKKQVQNMLH